MSDPRVGDLGEFALIERLRAGLPGTERLVLGIGDDAAVWRAEAGAVLATTDTMVEGVHFLPDACAEDVGWKALAVNISDIAAMGGTPAFALVTLCLPSSTPVARVDALYAGLRACSDAYGVTIAGGDVVSSPVLTITIALYGKACADEHGAPRLLRRDGGQAGDIVAVTGHLGAAAGGLRVLHDHTPPDDSTRTLVARQQRPQPRLDAGRAAIDSGLRCAIDISDGLLQDLGHIGAASACGADLRLDAIPVEPALHELFPSDAVALALSGGEDYELIIVGPRDRIEAASALLDTPLVHVGAMTDDAQHGVRVLDADGREVSFEHSGWDHLAANDHL